MRAARWLICVLVLTCPGWAVAKTDTPKGRPFVQLQEQITEIETEVATLQEQVQNAIGQFVTLEERVIAAESAILSLEGRNAMLRSQIDAQSGDVSSLEAQVAQNSSLIIALQDDVAETLDLLVAKQNVINGSCAEGYAVRQVNEDGSVVCEPMGGAGGGALETVIVTNVVTVAPGVTMGARVDCPAGFVPTGGGFRLSTTLSVVSTQPTVRGWRTDARNPGPGFGTLLVTAQCTGLR